LNQPDPHSLAKTHHCHAVHQENPELSYRLESLGGTGLHRQAVPQGNPENTQIGMSL